MRLTFTDVKKYASNMLVVFLTNVGRLGPRSGRLAKTGSGFLQKLKEAPNVRNEGRMSTHEPDLGLTPSVTDYPQYVGKMT